MVRAILDGCKTQTRRVMKVQPSGDGFQLLRVMSTTGPKKHEGKLHWARLSENRLIVLESDPDHFDCPYGQPGDQLWVRETFQPVFADGFDHDSSPYPNYKTGFGYSVSYPATDGIIEFVNGDDDVVSTCKPSIFMPRWASRIQLEIVSVRVERLNDISEADAQTEGMRFTDYGRTCFHHGAPQDVGSCTAPASSHQTRPGWHYDKSDHQDQCYGTAKYAFASLWQKINGAGSWAENPWVWVVEFKRI